MHDCHMSAGEGKVFCARFSCALALGVMSPRLSDPHRYEDGYDGSEPIIADLWEVLLALDEDEKKLFLKFVSGRCAPLSTYVP